MFKQIPGQEKAINHLKKFIAAGRVPPALLFYGPPGVGKTSAARAFAMALNCADPAAQQTQDACGVCQSCKNILAGTHPDYVFADFNYQAALTGKEVEKQQHISVETVRSVTAKSQMHSVMGGYKVIVVCHAETMQSEAANALLKFIEEPPYKTVWILLTSKREVMLSTIKSRSQAIGFAGLSAEIIENILEKQGYEKALARRAAKYAGGSAGKAAQLVEVFAELDGLDSAAPQFPYEAAATLSRTLAVSRKEAALILDIAATGLHGMWAAAKDAKIKSRLKEQINKISHFKRAVTRNVSPALVVETALMETAKINAELFG